MQKSTNHLAFHRFAAHGTLVGAVALPCPFFRRRQVLAAGLDPFLPNPVLSVSTVPVNGDVNPYGVAFVPQDFPTGGILNPGDILVSNFNNALNLQGTGTNYHQNYAHGPEIRLLSGDGSARSFHCSQCAACGLRRRQLSHR